MNLKDLIEDYGDYEVEDVEEIKKLLSKKNALFAGRNLIRIVLMETCNFSA